MKLYFAGAEQTHGFLPLLYENGVREMLMSFYYWDGGWDGIADDVALFADSGAFSAWRQHAKIDLHKYARWIQERENRFDAYANLDVIGDAKRTAKNQRILESLGLDPLPVFHFGSDFRVLRSLCASYEYVALGGLGVLLGAGRRHVNAALKLVAFCRDAFGIARDRKTKLHGFGLTALGILKMFPWYSVDSTSWLSDQKWGHATRFQRGTLVQHHDRIEQVHRFHYGSLPLPPRIGAAIREWVEYARHLNEFQQASGIGYGYWTGRATDKSG